MVTGMKQTMDAGEMGAEEKDSGRSANTKKRLAASKDCLLADCEARLRVNRDDFDALMTRGSLNMRKGAGAGVKMLQLCFTLLVCRTSPHSNTRAACRQLDHPCDLP